MSRLSEYNDYDVKKACSSQDLEHLAGVHVNGGSSHQVWCKVCSRPDVKTSKILMSGRGRCRFIPCKARGVLTMQYINQRCLQLGFELKKTPHPHKSDVVNAKVRIEFIREVNGKSESMTERWKTIKERINCHRPAFVPDKNKKPMKDNLSAQYCQELGERRKMKFYEPYPKNRTQKTDMKCLLCGLPQKHTIRALELDSFKGCNCQIAFKKFSSMKDNVTDMGFSFIDEEAVQQKFMEILLRMKKRSISELIKH